MAIVFGSEAARAVLLRDRARRGVEVLTTFSKRADGKPLHYVAALWEQWRPDPDDPDVDETLTEVHREWNRRR